ncbi:MAG: hypothetical protein ACE366_09550 [Bradymonadia bacterium]
MSEQKLGLWGQFVEMVGISWPGRPEVPKPTAPVCMACLNPAQNIAADGETPRWQCPHHPDSELIFEESA